METTEAAIIAQMNIKERNRYLQLETMALSVSLPWYLNGRDAVY